MSRNRSNISISSLQAQQFTMRRRVPRAGQTRPAKTLRSTPTAERRLKSRGLDDRVSSKCVLARRIGGRLLIAGADLRNYAGCVHTERIVG
jgi:hypothetical protein